MGKKPVWTHEDSYESDMSADEKAACQLAATILSGCDNYNLTTGADLDHQRRLANSAVRMAFMIVEAVRGARGGGS